MDPMFLPGVESNPAPGSAYTSLIEQCRERRIPFPQIWHLFAFKPNIGNALEQFTHEVMRGPSPLSPGFRELIAALTSVRNQCPF